MNIVGIVRACDIYRTTGKRPADMSAAKVHPGIRISHLYHILLLTFSIQKGIIVSILVYPIIIKHAYKKIKTS